MQKGAQQIEEYPGIPDVRRWGEVFSASILGDHQLLNYPGTDHCHTAASDKNYGNHCTAMEIFCVMDFLPSTATNAHFAQDFLTHRSYFSLQRRNVRYGYEKIS